MDNCQCVFRRGSVRLTDSIAPRVVRFSLAFNLVQLPKTLTLVEQTVKLLRDVVSELSSIKL